ncbi:hypothetical protein [Pseudomonas sp. 8 R 14]|nr:hypothetical protein [Pseudomonas sp. 8 R 14]SAM30498.1 hypothetical protein BN1864_LIB5394:00545 [Pseudomonas sp. 1 R 17]
MAVKVNRALGVSISSSKVIVAKLQVIYRVQAAQSSYGPQTPFLNMVT